MKTIKKSRTIWSLQWSFFSPKKRNQRDNVRAKGQAQARTAKGVALDFLCATPLPSNQPKKVGCDNARGQGQQAARAHTQPRSKPTRGQGQPSAKKRKHHKEK